MFSFSFNESISFQTGISITYPCKVCLHNQSQWSQGHKHTATIRVVGAGLEVLLSSSRQGEESTGRMPKNFSISWLNPAHFVQFPVHLSGPPDASGNIQDNKIPAFCCISLESETVLLLELKGCIYSWLVTCDLESFLLKSV